jgi:hypothetical protein
MISFRAACVALATTHIQHHAAAQSISSFSRVTTLPEPDHQLMLALKPTSAALAPAARRGQAVAPARRSVATRFMPLELLAARESAARCVRWDTSRGACGSLSAGANGERASVAAQHTQRGLWCCSAPQWLCLRVHEHTHTHRHTHCSAR